jgi:putative transposase
MLSGDGRSQTGWSQGACSHPGDGYRESTESRAVFLRDLKKRGMRAPVLAVGDCALGFWSALRYVFPKTRHQRDWVHKSANVLDSLPKSVHRRAKGAIKEITRAENKIEASIAIHPGRRPQDGGGPDRGDKR